MAARGLLMLRRRLSGNRAPGCSSFRSAAQWPAAALIGFIYTATPFLDLDCGYQRRLNRSAPDNEYLLGATFRW
jgi:hypothetical protein